MRGLTSKYSQLPLVQRSYNSKKKLLLNLDTNEAFDDTSENIFSAGTKTSRRPKSTKVGRNIKKNVWMGH